MLSAVISSPPSLAAGLSAAASRRGSARLVPAAPAARPLQAPRLRLPVAAAAARGTTGEGVERRGLLLAGVAAVAGAAVSPPALAERKLTYGPQAVALITPTKGSKVEGTVTFREATTRAGRVFTEVTVELSGLKPGKHGINIHEVGGVTCDDGECTGKSYNPGGLPHGDRDTIKSYGASAAHYNGDGRAYIRHAGDLGNVVASEDGRVAATFEDNVVCITGTKKSKAKLYNVVGRSVVVRAGEDNLTDEQDDGRAGPIVGFGTIA